MCGAIRVFELAIRAVLARCVVFDSVVDLLSQRAAMQNESCSRRCYTNLCSPSNLHELCNPRGVFCSVIYA